MGMWAVIFSLFSGGGGYTVFEVTTTYLIEQGDERWVTIASQNKKLMFEIEDRLRKINRKIKNGTATQDDMVDKAVFEERLRQLK